MKPPPYLPALLAAGFRSTEPSSMQQAWAQWRDQHDGEAQARALQAPLNAQSYSARVEAGIRRAVGAVPVNGVRISVSAVLDWIAEKGPNFFGLERLPDKDGVRKVIRAMKREAMLQSVAGGKPV